ncbi:MULTISPECIES: toxin regulator [unclassified Sporosarcina]|uniref:toxin regulator n=1 Tax=unclassified Sporosarcina TaxID=2647733 RepID=UPI000C167AF3|nr:MULTISPECIES: toxin regulator [unclassified Sporosarcina]PID05890.1 toxin regulator [Sporosarcina sp. P30]PID09084.1 toxin regulator [Sporosarcina sp. P31]PID12381.1 toxin regulator [Sporosarcina sp. P32b]
MKFLVFLRERWKFVLTALIALIIGAMIGPSQDQLDSANASVKELKKELSVKTGNEENLGKENKELQAKVDEAAPFFKLKEEERKQQVAEAKAAEEKRLAKEKAKQVAEAKAAEEKRLAEEKAKQVAEAKEKAEAEAKAKQGYNTGITYNQLARTPDEFLLEKVKFRGKVIQVIEDDGETQIRLAINDNYDTIVLAIFDSSIVSSRVLEDDWITIYGISKGLITYESTMGGSISIPGIAIDKIDQ